MSVERLVSSISNTVASVAGIHNVDDAGIARALAAVLMVHVSMTGAKSVSAADILEPVVDELRQCQLR